MRLHTLSRAVALVILAASTPANTAAAELGARSRAGSCAAFVKRVENADRAGVVRPDLYDGLSGWIAMKGRLHPDDVDAAARSARPDASSCSDFALAPEALRALHNVVVKVPIEKVRASIETCLADLRLLDELAEGPRQAALRALDAAQAKTVGRLLGYLAQELKPAAGAVQARVEALRDGSAGDLRRVALGPALATCETLGVDVAQLRQAHASL